MRSKVELARHLLTSAFGNMNRNVEGLKLDEALYHSDGYRSILGVLKHTGGWGHVYHSYAFDSSPRHWNANDWPRGLRDTIDKSQEYLDEVIQWCQNAHEKWLTSLEKVDGKQLDEKRPVHWGDTAPLFDIVVMVANHVMYHTGELNMLLSMTRGEAWEETEEVEENHIDTVGARVTPLWMRERPTYPLRQATVNKSDEEIEAWLNAQGGADVVMERIFEGMQKNLNPEWEEDVTVGYEFTAGGKSYPFAVTVKDRNVTYEPREPSDARVTLQISFPDYIRLITSQLDAGQAVSSGRLTFKGDVAYAQELPRMYRR